ncbi:hypothetical protein SPSIL_042950 [Sporomusa silvacetica DSM 10669]|uniref:Sulfatase N-terminal domain-containing protein n=1 Tax=Sporomusa silvacetica DSM 10669 TaxID=1123289 RepID=A0ABZ3IQY2_9FIRM|nr:lipoteichoic acid synthase 1 [Sporomusa silvacetica DSM 10669]
MSRWDIFFKQIQHDLKLYVYVLAVFCLFRLSFILILNNYLEPATSLADILAALYNGLHISLKSSGIVVLLSFLFGSILVTIFNNSKFEKIRFILGSLYIFLLTVLFHVRIPYYEVFHVAFSPFLFNTFNDDVGALLVTIWHEYHIPLKLLSIFCCWFILSYILKKWLQTKTIRMPHLTSLCAKTCFRTSLILCIAVFMIFTRFGGSLTYANSIHWENAAVSKDNFLNEAILDDVQALYRAYSTYNKFKKATNLNINSEQVHNYGALLAGHTIVTTNVEDYLKREAQGAMIPKPSHIFLIIGESYAEWPLLPEFKDLNIANEVKGIIDKDNAVIVKPFLPAGSGTAIAVNSIVTGLPNLSLYPNYKPESYKGSYATAIGLQMKQLGYKTRFCYAGFGSWQRIKEFTLAQGFDEFFSCSDFKYDAGNAWGSEDKYFLEAITTLCEDNQPSFNVILTSSNHPPYTVDLAKEGFDESIVASGLNDTSDKELINKLGHFWYSDKQLGNFIKSMQQKYPDSLFVITGDHADRFNIIPNPTMFERYAVPFILYGPGINKNMFTNNVAGSHITIAPTLIELIAPKDFVYYTVGESLTRGNSFGFNDTFWITNENIGEFDSSKTEMLSVTHRISAPKPDLTQQKQLVDAMQGLSWWRIMKGNQI